MARTAAILCLMLAFPLRVLAGEPEPATRTADAAADLDRARTLAERAAELERLGRAAEAVTSSAEALAIRERLLAPESPEVARSLDLLGSNLKEAKDYKRARPVLERAVARAEAAFGPDAKETGWAL